VVLLVSVLFTFECVSFIWKGIGFLIREFDIILLLLWKRWEYNFFPFSSLFPLTFPLKVSKMILSYSILFSFSLFSTNAHAGEVEEREKKLGIKSALIPSGSFQMGCTKGDGDCGPDEKPQHEVRLTKSFYMMTTEATQGLYKTIMNTNPSYFSSCGDMCPVEQVSWYDAVRYSNALNEKLGLESCYEIGSGDKPSVSWSNKECSGWRLPTEAEWEYAARGGESFKYVGSNNIDDVGWYSMNSGTKTHPVGQKKANGFGLYDMGGNVYEWVWDSGYRKYVSSVTDPIYVDTSSHLRVFRGGSWYFDAGYARVSNRLKGYASDRYDDRGFRFLRTIP
jgi:formylglycine-generating enzyme required for sulfatase activity